MTKPRVQFCWHCGRKMRTKRGGGFSFIEKEIDGHVRVMHIECAERPEIVNPDFEILGTKGDGR